MLRLCCCGCWCAGFLYGWFFPLTCLLFFPDMAKIPPYFEFHHAVKLLCGDGALERMADELRHLGACRPLLLTDAVLARIGTAGLAVRALADEGCPVVASFSDIPVDSSLSLVDRLAALFRELGADSLVAVGGGSVIDTAKGLRLVLSQGAADLLSLAGVENLCRGNFIPFIAVPTTAGTGSECTGVAVIRNDETHVKMEFLSPFIAPDVAVIDPRMTLGLPPAATASTGFDALCHAVESATCLQANPLSAACAHGAMSLIMQNLERAVCAGGDREARYAMALASTMAGIAFSNAMVGLVHAIGHALGGVCRVPHAVAMMILLPHVMRFNLPNAAADYAALLPHLVGMEAAMGVAAEGRAEASIAAIADLAARLVRRTGLPGSLSAAGVRSEDFARVARVAIDDGSIIVNPRAADESQVEAILRAAF